MKTYTELRTASKLRAIVLYTEQKGSALNTIDDYTQAENILKTLGRCFDENGSIDASYKGVF